MEDTFLSPAIAVKNKDLQIFCKSLFFEIFQCWSERHDSNVRPLPPQGSALAKLSYAPITNVSISYAEPEVKRATGFNPSIYLLEKPSLRANTRFHLPFSNLIIWFEFTKQKWGFRIVCTTVFRYSFATEVCVAV
jgi:hypothetical protein